MKQPATLFASFSTAINWNALLYTTYKITFTAQSFLLYRTLTTIDFATWANLNSITYLLLLWIDFGLRKSIPRYAPEFAQSPTATHAFTRAIILFQFTTLCLAAPFFLYVITRMLTITNPYTLVVAGCLFVTSGLTALMRLMYHAHFLNKQFNLLATVAMLTQTTIDITIITILNSSTAIVIGVLTTKIISNCIIIAGSIGMHRTLHNNSNPQEQAIDMHSTSRAFIKHSAIMWLNNNLKSISERNFLVPLLTHTIGPAQANMFKIANDAALLFYRIVIKTIDTADTTLLAHIEVGKWQELMADAFKKVTTKIATLCFPLLGVVVLIGMQSLKNGSSNTIVFQAFILMALAYLVETIFIPYERVLEVKRNYGYLAIAYIPYIVVLIILLLLSDIPSIGLVYSIGIIHSVRLVSLALMIYFARAQYKIHFPLSYVIKVAGISFIGLCVGYAVLKYLEPYIPVWHFPLFNGL